MSWAWFTLVGNGPSQGRSLGHRRGRRSALIRGGKRFLEGNSVQAAFLVSAVIAALGVIVALGRGKEKPNERTPERRPADE